MFMGQRVERVARAGDKQVCDAMRRPTAQARVWINELVQGRENDTLWMSWMTVQTIV
jgi:hypothetical protein